MWDKYIDYDKAVEEMIRCHKDNIAALESLREQLAEMGDGSNLKAIQYDADSVQTSPEHDALVNQVIQRDAIKEKIRELEKENTLFENAWRKLPEKERRILDIFYMEEYQSEEAARIVAELSCCDRSTAFRKRANAIQRFKWLLLG